MGRIVRIVAVALGLLGGTVASQLPEFGQQYRQRLGGAIDELRRVVQRFEADAQATGLSREGAIARLRGDADDLLRRQGEAMQGNMDRLVRLERHREDLITAGPFTRMALMVRDMDVDIARATYGDFEPALPVTEEGVLAAVAGFIATWGGLLLLAGFVRSLGRGLGRRPHPVRV